MSWQNYTQRFIKDNIIINQETGCWEWQMQRDDKNYGRCSKGSGEVLSHRLAYRLFVGDIGHLFVLHKCDNPPCCNPEHLFLGTQAHNIMDSYQKGRHPLDPSKAIEANKIPEEKRLEIVRLAGKGVKTGIIASKVGVSVRTVSRIKQTSL